LLGVLIGIHQNNGEIINLGSDKTEHPFPPDLARKSIDAQPPDPRLRAGHLTFGKESFSCSL